MAAGPSRDGQDTFRKAHDELLADRGLQFELPATPPPPPPPAWGKWLVEFLQAAGPVLMWVFWAGVAIVGALILYFIGRELIRLRFSGRGHGRGQTDARTAAADWRPEAAAARVLLGDADKLAAEGRFAEAAHLLLLRSIEDITSRRPRAVRPALTARDIGALEVLPAAARPAFGRIAEVVERSLFGGRPVDEAAWTDCRRAYEDFAFPERWRG